MGGAPDHPQWYLNLTANPHAEIQVKGEHIPVVARTASAEEKPRLWKHRARGLAELRRVPVAHRPRHPGRRALTARRRWTDGAFDGVRVVELAQWVFVPVAGALLADWGADVVRVDRPEGDPYRGLVTQGIGVGQQRA